MTDPILLSVTLKLKVKEGGACLWHSKNPLASQTSAASRWRSTQPRTELRKSVVGYSLLPFLGPRTTVLPKLCTAALFKSDMMLHWVRPILSHMGKARYYFTIWCDETLTNSDEHLFLGVQHLKKGVLSFLRRSTVQRTLFWAVYKAEYKAPLAECFSANTVELGVGLREHHTHLQQLLIPEKLRVFVKDLKEYREELSAE
nr:unnamed protein product [Leishmania braziliensis]